MTRTTLLGALVGALSLGAGGFLLAQEKLTLTTPVYQDVGAAEFRPWTLYLKRAAADGGAEIVSVLREVNSGTATFKPSGKTVTCHYAGADAEALIVALNKADLRTNTLERRVITRCQQDGKLGAGIISGSPE